MSDYTLLAIIFFISGAAWAIGAIARFVARDFTAGIAMVLATIICAQAGLERLAKKPEVVVIGPTAPPISR